MNFNPSIKDFLEKKPDITVIGLYWAGAWRFTVVYVAICTMALGIISVLDK